MKTTQMKKTITAFCALLIVSIGFWACRKQDYSSKDKELMNLVNGIRKWYDTASVKKMNFQGEQMATLSINGNANESNLVVDNIAWDKAAINYDSAQKIGIKIPVYKNSVTGEMVELATINNNGKVNAVFVKTIPDSIWYAKNKILNSYKYVSGTLKIYSITGIFLTKAYLKDGLIDNNTAVTKQNNTKINITTFGVDLEEVTVYSFRHSIYIYFNQRDGQNTNVVDIVYNFADEGGGGAPAETPKNLDSILNELDSFPCAQYLLLSPPLNSNCVEINSLIKNTFNLNNDIKLTFKVDNSLTLSNLLNGYTNTPSLSYGMYRQNIFLNPGVLSNSTQEFIFATMLHEGVHAVLDFWNDKYRRWRENHNDPEGIDSFQLKQMFPIFWDYKRALTPSELAGHNQMAEMYINQFKANLFSLNPSLNDDMATALAWKGLQESTAWKSRTDINNLNLLIHIARRDTLVSNYLSYGMSKCN